MDSYMVLWREYELLRGEHDRLRKDVGKILETVYSVVSASLDMLAFEKTEEAKALLRDLAAYLEEIKNSRECVCLLS